MENKKDHLNVVVIGTSDAGKSTLAGHLLSKLGNDTEKINKIVAETQAKQQTAKYKYSWIMDTLKAERQKGITIDISLRKFETQKYRFTIIDAPGHRDFIKNMITGTSQADVALLVIGVPTDLQTKGVISDGQTRQHALLAFTLGVRQLIVAINKMDLESVKFNKANYDFAIKQISDFLKKVGFNPNHVPFIPTSALNGDNLFEKSQNLPWYQGPTIVEALDSMQPPKRLLQKPLRIPIQQVYNIKGIGTIPVGRIQSGIIKPGMTISIVPGGFSSKVKSVETHNQPLTEGTAGDSVGFMLQNSPPNTIRRGYVAGDANNDPPRQVQSFLAQVIVLNHPGSIQVGYTPIVDCHTTHIACRFDQFLSKIDRSTGNIIEENPKSINNGECAMIVMKPTKPMCCETINDYPALGRFAARDLKRTVAVGVIKKCQKKNPKK